MNIFLSSASYYMYLMIHLPSTIYKLKRIRKEFAIRSSSSSFLEYRGYKERYFDCNIRSPQGADFDMWWVFFCTLGSARIVWKITFEWKGIFDWLGTIPQRNSCSYRELQPPQENEFWFVWVLLRRFWTGGRVEVYLSTTQKETKKRGMNNPLFPHQLIFAEPNL